MGSIFWFSFFVVISLNTVLFLDWSKHITVKPMPDERGLLGMAFDPNFKNNGVFYFNDNIKIKVKYNF